MVEQVTKMHKIYGRLPELLRESQDNRCRGWAAHPFGKIIGRPWSYCAVGTISHAMGDSPIRTFFLAYNREKLLEFCGMDIKYKLKPFSDDNKQHRVICPTCDKKVTVTKLFVHNNDDHNMSFSENADALEKVDSIIEPGK